MANLSLYKFLAPEFVFGADARKLAGRYARLLGAGKLFIATDNGVIQAGWVDDIIRSIHDENIPCFIFSAISPNPRDYEVMKGAELYAREKCDAILAIGGGSVIDCAKGIGIVSTNQQNILGFEGIDNVPVPMPPLIAIPTTGGTSADVSQFAIINNTSERVKIAIISKSVVPDIALIDPVTLLTMDPMLTACTGIDALVHAIEAYVSNAASSFTDIHALQAIDLIANNLISSVRNPDDIEIREKIMLGSLHAGLAFSNASLGCTHSMAHSLGGYLDLPHGACNAMLLPHVVDFNFPDAADRFKIIAEHMKLSPGQLPLHEFRSLLVKELIGFIHEAGITDTLAVKGVTSATTATLAEKAIKDPCNATNPRAPEQEDLRHIFLEAL
jgi:alcohol dehydrogenase class IV